jgi:hypothetical protein
LQTLASYGWSHSIDTASAGSFGNASNLAANLGSNANRGSSDFDVRHAISVGVTYQVPTWKATRFTSSILGAWSLQSIVQARTAQPVDLTDASFSGFNNRFFAAIRPDLVSGQNVDLSGAQYPGGKAFNSAAFQDPPIDPNSGNPIRQGDTSRNFLRGFRASQWDFAVHRDFPIFESLKLQFRAEMFNLLNHPNFGPPKCWDRA